jgi:hypothetical protein
MKEALIYFLKELQDPYLLSQLLEIKNESDECIIEEIEETYGIEVDKIFKHFKNLPLNMEIGIHSVENFDDSDWEDVTPKFEVKQQLLMCSCDGDTYLIQLPIKIM